MPKLAVVYHSEFGHTKAVAERISEGAQNEGGVEVILIRAKELPDESGKQLGGRWDELATADCIVFGCPTYMGSVTSELKRVFEASSKFWFEQRWRDKLASGFTNAAATSGDKLNTLQDIFHFCMQHSMLWVSQGVMFGGPTENDINRMGSYMGCMAQSDDASPDVTPPAGDRKTAELFGARLAQITKRYAQGAPE